MGRDRALIKAVLSVIAISVAGFFIYRSATHKDPGAPPKETTFICKECSHEFNVDTDETTRLQAENPDKNGKIKCPDCGKFKAMFALRCLYCRKYYLRGEATGPGGDKYECPHCGKTPDGEKEHHGKNGTGTALPGPVRERLSMVARYGFESQRSARYSVKSRNRLREFRILRTFPTGLSWSLSKSRNIRIQSVCEMGSSVLSFTHNPMMTD